MMLFENFKQGLNLGGFLSQYELIADSGSILRHLLQKRISGKSQPGDLIMSESPWTVICFLIRKRSV